MSQSNETQERLLQDSRQHYPIRTPEYFSRRKRDAIPHNLGGRIDVQTDC